MRGILKYLLLLFVIFIVGCGYSTRSALPNHLQSIFIPQFKNKINFTTDQVRNTYFPLLEVRVRNAVIRRYLFDGNLDVAESADAADLILNGELIGYDRTPLRYTDNDDVLEYRVQIIVNLEMIDTSDEVPLWVENGFVGEATYFVSGPAASTEAAAVERATVDIARRIVEHTVENW